MNDSNQNSIAKVVKFVYAAAAKFDGSRAIIVAPTMDELEEAWDRLLLGDVLLDRAKVERVKITKADGLD